MRCGTPLPNLTMSFPSLSMPIGPSKTSAKQHCHSGRTVAMGIDSKSARKRKAVRRVSFVCGGRMVVYIRMMSCKLVFSIEHVLIEYRDRPHILTHVHTFYAPLLRTLFRPTQLSVLSDETTGSFHRRHSCRNSRQAYCPVAVRLRRCDTK